MAVRFLCSTYTISSGKYSTVNVNSDVKCDSNECENIPAHYVSCLEENVVCFRSEKERKMSGMNCSPITILLLNRSISSLVVQAYLHNAY